MWSPWTTDHGNFYLKFFLLRTKCLLKANKQAKKRGPPRGSQATRNNGQHNSPVCTDVLFVKKTDKTKTRHRVRIYILVSGEPSGFTILLLVIRKFFDSTGKFLKGAHSKQQPTTQHASDAHSSPRAVQFEKLWQTASKRPLCHQFGFDQFWEVNKLFPQNNSPKTTLGKKY